MKHRSMKKVAALVLSILLVFPLLNLRAEASGVEQSEEYGYLYEHPEHKDAYNAILQGIKNRVEHMDISKYKVQYDEDLGGSPLFDFISFENPELFYFNYWWGDKEEGTDGKRYCSDIYLEYSDEYATESHQKLFDDAVEKALSCVKPGMTDLEKALALHDYLVSIGDSGAELPTEGLGAYNVLVLGEGSKSDYSRAYAYLLNKCGIDSVYASEKPGYYYWNMIKINGQWYNVDCDTDCFFYRNSDDPNKWSYFMLSDEQMAYHIANDTDPSNIVSVIGNVSEYESYNKRIACSDQRYDEADWSRFTTEAEIDNILPQYEDPYETAEEYDDLTSAEKAMGRAALGRYNYYLSEYLSDKASSETVPLTWFENASARFLRNLSNGGKVAIAISTSGVSADAVRWLDSSLFDASRLVYSFSVEDDIIDKYENFKKNGRVITVFSFSDHALDLVREFDKACDDGLSLLKDGMNDLEKALTLHNYICMTNSYAYKDGAPDGDKYSAYDCLVKRSSVCSGYTRGLNCLLRRAGLETGTSTSDDINHIWNLVKLDGKWYAVDATWDDPGSVYGEANDYGYFLLSDDTSVLYHAANQGLNTITIENEDDYDNEISAIDKRYEAGYFWNEGDVTSAIYVEPGEDASSMEDDWFVYMSGAKLVRRDGINGKEQTLINIDEVKDWWFSSVLIGCGNGYLLNDSDHLYFVPNSDSTGFAGGTSQKPYFYTIPDFDRYDIAGFFFSKNESKAYFTLIDTIDGGYVTKVMNVTLPDPDSEVVPIVNTESMYRLYNPNSGEHFYTGEEVERDDLVSYGWIFEGEAWITPMSSNTPVYRVYNPNSGEHHYTKDASEKDFLVGLGWNDEGIGWYSDDNQGTPLYRLYNPNATGQYEAGGHHYTKDTAERDRLIGLGWNDEGIGWYGV